MTPDRQLFAAVHAGHAVILNAGVRSVHPLFERLEGSSSRDDHIVQVASRTGRFQRVANFAPQSRIVGCAGKEASTLDAPSQQGIETARPHVLTECRALARVKAPQKPARAVDG